MSWICIEVLLSSRDHVIFVSNVGHSAQFLSLLFNCKFRSLTNLTVAWIAFLSFYIRIEMAKEFEVGTAANVPQFWLVLKGELVLALIPCLMELWRSIYIWMSNTSFCCDIMSDLINFPLHLALTIKTLSVAITVNWKDVTTDTVWYANVDVYEGRDVRISSYLLLSAYI